MALRGLGPGFSAWLPLQTELTADNVWIGKFPIDDEVSLWGMRKFCHWEVEIDILAAFAVGALGAIGGFVPVTGSMSTAAAPGIFEYKIIAPDGSVVMHQKVHLTMWNVFLTESALGLLSIGFYVWNHLDDRSYHFRTRRTMSTGKNEKPSINPPVVLAKRDSLDYDTGEALIRYHGTPTLNDDPDGAPVTKIGVQRAKIEDGDLDKAGTPALGFTDVGELTYNESAQVWEGLFDQPKGEVYVYRLTAEDSFSDGISVVCFGKNSARSRIETFVINGYPTVSNQDLDIPGSSRLAYDEYQQWVWFPKGREEIMYLDPAAGTDYTDRYGLIDTWCNMPVYNFRIPAGSELRLMRDYFALPGGGGRRVRNKEWQFSYKTFPMMWNTIKQIAGNMLQTQTDGSDVAIVYGEVPNTGPITSSRALVFFQNSRGAFLYATKNGTIYCGIMKGETTELHMSTDGAKSFQPVLGAYATNTPSIDPDTGQEIPRPAIKLFGGDSGYRIIDMYRDSQFKIYILAEHGDYLYVQIDPANSGGFDDMHLVGKKKPKNLYKFVDYTDKTGDKMMVVAGSTHSFVSTDGGKTWGLPEGYTEEDDKEDLSDKYFDDETANILDGGKTNTDKQLILAEKGNNLYVEVRHGGKVQEVYIGPKKSGNVYTLETYSSPASDGTLAVFAKNHRYVSSNGGLDWTEQEVVEE